MLEEIAENDEHAQWTVEQHQRSVRFGTRPRCTVCEEWWPCERASLSALAVLRKQEVDRLRAPFSNEVISAAGRLIRMYDRRQAHVMEKPDIITVARAVLAHDDTVKDWR